MTRKRWNPWSVLLLYLATACSGAIEGGEPSGDGRGAKGGSGAGRSGGNGARTGGSTGAGGGDVLPPDTGPFECKADLSSTPRRLWRLTKAQYANTIAVAINGRLNATRRTVAPPDGIAPPFDTVANGDRFSTLSLKYGMTDIELGRALGAANDLAPKLVAALRAQSGSCLAAKQTFKDCVPKVVSSEGELLFRRPLVADEIASYAALAIDNVAALAGGEDEALALAFSAMLMSPSFLYRVEVGEGTPGGDGLVKLSPFQIAESLAYSLTDFPPDEELWAAAQGGKLGTTEQIESQVLRLLGGDAATGAPTIARFFLEYFKYGGVTTVFKDPKDYPFYDRNGLLDDTNRLVADVLATNGHHDLLKTLLSTPTVFSRASTQQSYGLTAAAAPQKLSAPDGQRAGILTQPSFLVAYSTANENRPVQRGRFIVESLLCGSIPDVQAGSVPPLPDLGPNATMRTKLTMHAAVPRCAACHDSMDPVGLALEQYDHVGRFRTMDQGKPADGSGVLAGAGEADGPFKSAGELMGKLAASSVVQRCFVRHNYRYWLGTPENDVADGCALAHADGAYGSNGGDYVKLVSSLFTSKSFLYRNTKTP